MTTDMLEMPSMVDTLRTFEPHVLKLYAKNTLNYWAGKGWDFRTAKQNYLDLASRQDTEFCKKLVCILHTIEDDIGNEEDETYKLAHEFRENLMKAVGPLQFKNKARCNKCNTTIESKFRHDFVSCACGACFVDGGNAYWRAGISEHFERLYEILE